MESELWAIKHTFCFSTFFSVSFLLLIVLNYFILLLKYITITIFSPWLPWIIFLQWLNVQAQFQKS